MIKKALNEDIFELNGNKAKKEAKKEKKQTQQLQYNYDFISRGRDHVISLA